MRGRLTTITFDFWGTLLVDGPGSDDRYRARRLQDFGAILGAQGCAVKTSDLERAYERSASYLHGVWTQGRDVTVDAHVRAVLGGVDESLADRLSAETMARLVDAYARPATLVPPAVDPGALGALEALCGQGYTLAVVSNTMRTPGLALRKVLERYGLLGYFTHTTFSDEVGIRKPAAEIFALTLRAVGGEPGRSLHVGDDAVLDVQGARGAGMRVVQIAADGTAAGGPGPDALIRTLLELPGAVAALDG